MKKNPGIFFLTFLLGALWLSSGGAFAQKALPDTPPDDMVRFVNDEMTSAVKDASIWLDKWFFNGPFEAVGDDPWKETLPVNAENVDGRKAYPVLGGTQQKWRKWEGWEKLPKHGKDVPVFYCLYQRFKAEKSTAYLMINQKLPFNLYLNGSMIYSTRNSGANFSWIGADSVKVKLKPESNNELFLRLYTKIIRFGIPGVCLTYEDPLEIRMAVLDKVFKKYSVGVQTDRQREQLATLCDLAAGQYLSRKDYQASLFWRERQLNYMKNDAERNHLVRVEARRIMEKKLNAYDAVEFYRKVSARKDWNITETGTDFLGDAILNHFMNRNDYQVLTQFLRDQKNISPFLRTKFMVLVAIRRGDYEEASDLLATAEEKYPELGKSSDFGLLKHFLSADSNATMNVPLDMNFENEINKIRLEAEKDKDSYKLFTMLRAFLSERSGLYMEKKSRVLYKCLLAEARERNKSYEQSYSKHLATYLEMLKKNLNYSDKIMKRREMQYAIQTLPAEKTSIPLKNTESLSGSFSSAGSYAYSPLAEIRRGLPEKAANNVYAGSTEKPRPAAVTFSGDKRIFQNTREILCFVNDVLEWKKTFSFSVPKLFSAQEAGVGLKHTLPKGIADEKRQRFFTRMLDNGTFSLYAFDLKNGEERWMFAPDGVLFCSDPFFYDDTLLIIGRENGGDISRFSLFLIDPETGMQEDRFYLFSGSEKQALGAKVPNSDKTVLLPSPAVSEGVLYINSNCGVMMAFDLRSMAPLWLRKYPAASFDTNEAMALSFEKRGNVAPVVGKKNVFFAPLDALNPILLDKVTGEFVGETPNCQWNAFRGDAPLAEKVYEISPEGVTAFSMNDLKELESLKVENPILIRDDPADTLLMIQADGELLFCNSALLRLKTVKLPENTNLLDVDQGKIYGYQTRTFGNEIGVLKQEKNITASNIISSVPERREDIRLGDFSAPFFWKDRDDIFIVSDDLVAKLNSDGSFQWVYPFRKEFMKLLNGDKILALVTPGRSILVNKETGKIVAMSPGYSGEKKLTEESFTLEKDILYSIAGHFRTGGIGFALWSLSEKDGVKRLNDIDVPGFVVSAILNEGKLLFGYNPGKQCFEFREQDAMKPALYKQTGDTRPARMSTLLYRINDSAYLLRGINGDEFHFLKPDGTIRTIRTKTPVPSPYLPNPQKDICIGDEYVTVRSIGKIKVMNWRKSAELAGVSELTAHPVLQGNILYGMAFQNMQPVRLGMDMKEGKVLFEKPLDFNTVFPKKNAFHSLMFAADGTFYTLLTLSADHRPIPYAGLLTAEKNGNVVLKAFPPSNGLEEVQVFGNTIYMIHNNQLDIMELPVFLNGLDGNIHQARQSEFKFVCDGYPDEWEADKFVDRGSYSCQFIQNKNILYAGVKIRDPEMIEAFGAKKIPTDSMLLFFGGAGTFNTEETPWQTFALSTETGINNPEDRFAWSCSVSPDGQELFLEFQVIPGRRFELQKRPEYKDVRDCYGDIAFDIAFTPENGREKMYLLSNKKFPAFFPRLRLSEPENKK